MQARNWSVNWDDAMRAGIAEIDADHKRFIALVHAFNKSIEVRMALSDVQNRLQDLLDDADAHFASEERLLREWGYPGADDHARVHAQLVEMLRNIKSTISQGYDAEWVEAGLRIKDALLSHVESEDLKFVEFFRSVRAAPDAEESQG